MQVLTFFFFFILNQFKKKKIFITPLKTYGCNIDTSFCSYAQPAQPCPIRRLGPLKSAETRVIKHPI